MIIKMDRQAALCIVISSALVFGCEDDTGPKVRPFSTSTKLTGQSLFLRMSQNRQSLLLLALGSSETPPGRMKKEILDDIATKRKPLIYTHGAQKLDITDGRIWASGDSEIADCTAQWIPISGKPLRFDGSAKTLLLDETILPTAGRSVIRAKLSPDKTYVAALSAEGAYDSGWFSGGSQAPGKRFHQVFRCADGTQVGQTLILSDAPEKDVMNQCWSPDGRWVVYDDANFERVWIVPGVKDDTGEKKP